MTDYTEANLEALYRRQPELKDKALKTPTGSMGIQTVATPSGFPTATLQGTFLHSRYDPVKEARRIIASQTPAPPSAAVVLGFGLGYVAEEFSNDHPDTPLVVVEQEARLFLQALAVRDLRKLLSKPGITWCIAEQAETVVDRVEGLPLRRLCILALAAVRKKEYYRRVDTLLSSIFDRREVNINTLKRFAELWVRNLLRNLGPFIKHPGIAAGQHLFVDIPALVVAAGPSLDEVLPDLEELRQRLLIVAVDTSYRFCKGRGLEPDFLVTVDPQYWNSRHLDWQDRSATILVSESSAHPRVSRSGTSALSEIFYVSSFFPLGRYIEEALGQRGLIGAGGSVATTAWDLCRYLGCSAIFMAGLDLGFPGKRTHARGAFFEESMHARSARFLGSEQMSFDYLQQAQPTALNNNRGGRTLTDRRMLIYKKWFETQVKQQALQGGPETFTLAAEGIAVEGMKFVAVPELRQLPRVRRRIDGVLRDLRRRGRRMSEAQQPAAVIQSLQRLGGELERLQELANRGAELAHSDGGSSALVPALAEVDRKIMSLASRQIVGFLFQSLIHEIVDDPGGSRDFSQALAASKRLYRELGRSAAYHRELIRRCLERT